MQKVRCSPALLGTIATDEKTPETLTGRIGSRCKKKTYSFWRPLFHYFEKGRSASRGADGSQESVRSHVGASHHHDHVAHMYMRRQSGSNCMQADQSKEHSAREHKI